MPDIWRYKRRMSSSWNWLEYRSLHVWLQHRWHSNSLRNGLYLGWLYDLCNHSVRIQLCLDWKDRQLLLSIETEFKHRLFAKFGKYISKFCYWFEKAAATSQAAKPESNSENKRVHSCHCRKRMYPDSWDSKPDLLLIFSATFSSFGTDGGSIYCRRATGFRKVKAKAKTYLSEKALKLIAPFSK